MLQSRRKSSRLRGANFENRHKSRCLQKSELVNWGVKHVDWGGTRPPWSPLGADPGVLCINIFLMKGVSFVAKLQQKIPRIVTPWLNPSFKHFCLLFANYISLEKRLLIFDQKLSACWKKSYGLRYRLPTHWSYFTSKISVNLFGSGSDRCGNGSCLQVYRFYIRGLQSFFFSLFNETRTLNGVNRCN